MNAHTNWDKILIEPFSGGGIIGLTAAFENLAKKIILVELDSDVASVWQTMLGDDNSWLIEQIQNFTLTKENALLAINCEGKTRRENAFATLLKNRLVHGGILAKGSGFIKSGENGKGIGSRWYPDTIARRIQDIYSVRSRIEFIWGDAFDIIEQYIDHKDVLFFVDPPYVKAGKRLYTHYTVDHEHLIRLISKSKGSYLVTYDDAPDIRTLAEKYEVEYRTVPMKTTHHLLKQELILSNSFDWFD